MQLETWYFIKEIDDILEDHKIHEVVMYKEDGRYICLCVEESGKGLESIANFPYRLYKRRSDAMEKFRNIKYMYPNYKINRLNDGGFKERSIQLPYDRHIEKIALVMNEEEDE